MTYAINKNIGNRDPSQNFNINQGWLFFLQSIIIRYAEALYEEDFNGMYKSLKLLEHTVSPKIDNNEIEKKLDEIRKEMDEMEHLDNNGNIVCYYPLRKRKVMKLMDETYALILLKMDEEGLLTRKTKDPGFAMGNFGGS